MTRPIIIILFVPITNGRKIFLSLGNNRLKYNKFYYALNRCFAISVQNFDYFDKIILVRHFGSNKTNSGRACPFPFIFSRVIF
jgi:hypothetical protein